MIATPRYPTECMLRMDDALFSIGQLLQDLSLAAEASDRRNCHAVNDALLRAKLLETVIIEARRLTYS